MQTFSLTSSSTGHRTIVTVPPPPKSAFARFAAQRSVLFAVSPGTRQYSGRSEQDWSSGDNGSSWRARFFNPWNHAGAAAMSGVSLIASAEELKEEQAQGDQLIDMIAPLLSQLSLGSALVCNSCCIPAGVQLHPANICTHAAAPPDVPCMWRSDLYSYTYIYLYSYICIYIVLMMIMYAYIHVCVCVCIGRATPQDMRCVWWDRWEFLKTSSPLNLLYALTLALTFENVVFHITSTFHVKLYLHIHFILQMAAFAVGTVFMCVQMAAYKVYI